MGDEFGNSQKGNNNPYCQDNVMTWLVWEAIDKEGHDLTSFVRRLITLRKKMGIFKRIKFFDGRLVEKFARFKVKDMMWIKNDGSEFETSDWYLENRRSIASFVYQENCSYMLICNANSVAEEWHLPAFCKNLAVEAVFDSSAQINGKKLNPSEAFSVPAWSVVVVEIKKPE